MSDTENNDITVIITDYEEPCRSGTSGDKPERPRLAAAAKLIALWNLLFELIVGVPFIILMAWVGDDFGAGTVVICGLLFACAHTAASAVSFKRYKRKYEVSALKFVLLNALPLFLVCAVVYVVGHTGIYGINGLGIAIFCVYFWGYSVVFAALLSAVLGIKHAVEKSCQKRKN